MAGPGKRRYLDMPAEGGRPQGTLVLLHAFPLSARMWEPQRTLARHGWRIVAPELRQFGGGSNEPPASSMDDYAGDVVDLLDELHLEHPVIGGLSMGGYVAFALMRHAPRYFRGLVLADTRPHADTPEGVEDRRRMLALVREHGAAAVAAAMLPRLIGATTQNTRSHLVERVRSIIEGNSVDAISGAITALMSRPDSSPLLSTIHCPTLIVVGEEDVLTPPGVSEGMHTAIAGSELVVIPAAGHLANLEHPEAFNAALEAFLTRRV
jgi:pimeloyl-ACP methyl ester carboxylesterase